MLHKIKWKLSFKLKKLKMILKEGFNIKKHNNLSILYANEEIKI